MPPRRKSDNLLDHKKASVSVHRNGLSIEVTDVTASDAGLVAAALLDAVRELLKAGYDELIVDAGGAHGGIAGDVPEDGDFESGGLPEKVEFGPRRIGFTSA